MLKIAPNWCFFRPFLALFGAKNTLEKSRLFLDLRSLFVYTSSMETKPVYWTSGKRKLRDLVPYPDNPRKITPEAGQRLRNSKRKFSQPLPILLGPDGELYDGHQRFDEWGDEWGPDLEVAVRVCNRALSEAERKELVVTLHEGATGLWDWEALPDWALPEDLAEWGFDEVDLAGVFDSPELPDAPDAQVDKAEELQQKWNVALGDLFVAGEHRLICGDCTDGATVERLMDGDRADLLFEDPPYGVKRDKGFGGADGFGGGIGKPIARRQYSDDWDSDRPQKTVFDLHLAHADKAIIFGGNFLADILPRSTHWIVWDKLNTMPTFGDCELAWTNLDRKSVKKITFEYNGLIGKEKNRYHPTQKPLGLYAEILTEYTKPGQIIIDFFTGSGTTLVACEQLGRRGRGVEIEPKYVSVCLERLSAMGLEPQRV